MYYVLYAPSVHRVNFGNVAIWRKGKKCLSGRQNPFDRHGDQKTTNNMQCGNYEFEFRCDDEGDENLKQNMSLE